MQSVLLGTAQWGMDYGVTNAEGRLTNSELASVVTSAKALGIRSLDTAPGYGDAESRIGAMETDFAIQTKVSASGSSPSEITASIEASMQRLGRKSLWSVLVHDWPLLTDLERDSVLGVLIEMRGSGLIQRLGVSGYDESDVEDVLRGSREIDVMQVPVSVLDQRLEDCAVVEELRSRGARIQARSIFLQGVLLDSAQATRHSAHHDVIRFREHAHSSGTSVTQAAVGYVKSRIWVDEVAVGFASGRQLDDFARAWDANIPPLDWQAYASDDALLLDPRSWETE